jgi:putative DNA primase/helicase
MDLCRSSSRLVTEKQIVNIFRTLVALGGGNPLHFRFDPDAQFLFVEWLSDLEVKVRGNDLHPALISHLSKYRSLMPSLPLLFELADRAASGTLSSETADLSSLWLGNRVNRDFDAFGAAAPR